MESHASRGPSAIAEFLVEIRDRTDRHIDMLIAVFLIDQGTKWLLISTSYPHFRPPGSQNLVPASAGVRAGMSPLPGSR